MFFMFKTTCETEKNEYAISEYKKATERMLSRCKEQGNTIIQNSSGDDFQCLDDKDLSSYVLEETIEENCSEDEQILLYSGATKRGDCISENEIKQLNCKENEIYLDNKCVSRNKITVESFTNKNTKFNLFCTIIFIIILIKHKKYFFSSLKRRVL